MGKKSKKESELLPFVSICTPTFNRRPFIPFIIKCFETQDYPKDRLEWIIIDDGTDPIGELVAHIPQVKYFRYDVKMSLGEKRNIMHDKSCGAILVYMDDDDYYPPERVSHAVDVLKKNPKALCAGSSEMYIYFKHIQKMYQFGPYGPNHATAATFAFRRELLSQTRYEDKAALAEEKHFLKDYTVPFVQLDPMKCILVFSHVHNSFDKKMLLSDAPNTYVKESTKKPSDFVKETDVLEFFMVDIDSQLEQYDPGMPKHKQDVLQQMKEMSEKREIMQKQLQEGQLRSMISQYEMNLSKLTLENIQLKEKVEYLNKKIGEFIQEKFASLKLSSLTPSNTMMK